MRLSNMKLSNMKLPNMKLSNMKLAFVAGAGAQAQRQAEERGAPLEYELALLVVHGVLHLTGHDHLEPEDTELMQSKERTALAALNIGT